MYKIEYLTVQLGTRHQKRCYRRKARGQAPKIFGCPIYLHVLKEKRLKLDPLGKKGIFIGYSETSNAYKVYIPG